MRTAFHFSTLLTPQRLVCFLQPHMTNSTHEVASYPGLPSQVFSQPWKKKKCGNLFFHSCENNCEGRPGYEATQGISTECILCEATPPPVSFWARAAACSDLLSLAASGQEQPTSPMRPHLTPVSPIPSMMSCSRQKLIKISKSIQCSS